MTISHEIHLRKTGEVANVNRGRKMVFSHSVSIITYRSSLLGQS